MSSVNETKVAFSWEMEEGKCRVAPKLEFMSLNRGIKKQLKFLQLLCLLTKLGLFQTSHKFFLPYYLFRFYFQVIVGFNYHVYMNNTVLFA